MAKAGVHLFGADGDRASLCCYVDNEFHTFSAENDIDNDDLAAAILVLRERQRQEAKFPGQRLISVAVDDPKDACMLAGVAHEDNCKRWAKQAIAEGRLSWADVLVEEVSEAICAIARGEIEHGIEELTQVAAVAVRWIGALRRGEAL